MRGRRGWEEDSFPVFPGCDVDREGVKGNWAGGRRGIGVVEVWEGKGGMGRRRHRVDGGVEGRRLALARHERTASADAMLRTEDLRSF